jgi:hypothetical protein
MGKVKKLSASSIGTFLECPLKYKFGTVDGIVIPSDSPHLLYGSAVHKAIEEYHKSIYFNNRLERKAIQKIFVDNWQIAIELNEVPIRWYSYSQEKDLTQAGIRTLGTYYETHKDDPPPPTWINFKGERAPAIEVGFNVSLKDLIPETEWRLSGIIDRIIPVEIIIEDHKTGSGKYSDFQVKTNLQLAIYSYAFRQLVNEGKFPDFKPGTKEEFVQFDILDKKSPKIHYHQRKISDKTYRHLGRIIRNIINQIERGEFLPNYGSACLAFGGCEFMSMCQDFQYE